MNKDTSYQKRSSLRDDELLPSASNQSESSPLRKINPSEGVNIKPRRRSTAEKLAVGIRRAIEAFEVEVISESSRSTSDTDFSDSVSDFDINGHYDTKHRSSSNTIWRCRQYTLAWLCIGLLLGMSFAIGSWTCHVTNEVKKLETSSTEDPILTLKDGSFVDGLENGAVAADHSICSEVGNKILQKGGNAVDAGVATVLCLGVANPASSGLGGGAFILIHSDKANYQARAASRTFPTHHDARDPEFEDSGDKITEVIDCREVAPGAATQDMYLSKPDRAASVGGLSIAVPGELRGLELAHARHGKLSWEDVLAPSIDLAQNGVPVSAHLANDIANIGELVTAGLVNPKLRKYLTKHDSWRSPLREGELLRNEKLARTLRQIAEKGSDALYEGQIARDIVGESAEEGGILTVDDLSSYHATLRTPVFGDAFGYKFAGVPPPSSGGATIFGALRFLEGYDSPLASDQDTLTVHR